MSYWILLLVSLLACSVGFHMYIWFFSVGYGLAIAAIGAALAVAFHAALSLPEWLACLLLMVYGLRLSGYLLLREVRSAGYRQVLSPERERSRKMPIFAKLSMWLACGLLYTLMTIPLFFRLNNGAPADAMLWVGLAVIACGIALEGAADLQKTRACTALCAAPTTWASCCSGWACCSRARRRSGACGSGRFRCWALR